MKTWIFKETGEVRCPKKGEWFLHGSLMMAIYDFDTSVFPILTLETFDHDPLEPIREVYTKWTGLIKDAPYIESWTPQCQELWQAVKKAMEG
jgi:hypothetical protein